MGQNWPFIFLNLYNSCITLYNSCIIFAPVFCCIILSAICIIFGPEKKFFLSVGNGDEDNDADYDDENE